MKKLLITTSVLLLSIAGFTQKKGEIQTPTFPKNKAGIITYAKSKAAKGSNEELFSKSMAWFNSFYPNAKGVIKTQNADNGEISGSAKYRIYDVDKKGVKTQAGMVSYSINVVASDGKFSYELTDFIWQQASKYKIERWEKTDDQYYDKQYVNYLIQTDEYAKDLVQKLNKAMAE